MMANLAQICGEIAKLCLVILTAEICIFSHRLMTAACFVQGRVRSQRNGQNKSPARRGETGRGLDARSPLQRPGQFAWADLLDDLNDAARARFDQYGAAIDHSVAIGRDGVGLRHVVIGHAGFRQHAAHHDLIRNRVV